MNLTPPAIAFNDRLARLIGIPVVGFLVPLIFYQKTLDNGLLAYLPTWAVATIYSFIYWHGSRAIYIWTHRRFPGIDQRNQRLVWMIGLCISFTVLTHFGCEWLSHELLVHPASPSQPTTFQALAGDLIPTFTCLTLYESAAYFQQLQLVLLEAEQLKKANAQSQLETLKNQVNPHFLFNSLNTLAAIIPEDADLAVNFVQKLSKVYRYILEIRDAQTVCLRDELSALRAYCFLLQIRFGANLTVVTNIPDAYLDHHVVPLSLQMLMENAVKHNVISTHKPLRVEVTVQHDRVVICNNLQRKRQVNHALLTYLSAETDSPDAPNWGQLDESTGLGLANIKDRYRLVAAQVVDVIVTTQTFAVSLPLLPQTTPRHERVAD